MIDNDVIEEIKSKADIVSVIGQYTDVTKRGRNYWAICPFHEDTAPSMSISPERNMFKCFVCGAGGNVFKFVQDFKRLTFPESVMEVAKSIGYDTTKIGTIRAKKVDPKKEMNHSINKEAMNYFKMMLKSSVGVNAMKYLHSRGITDAEINKFNIGYSSNEGLTTFLTKKGFEINNLIECGLSYEKDGNFIDQFRNRVMFTIQDDVGEVVGFSARTLMENDKFAKYINTKETYVFKKSSILYNFHNAINEIRKTKRVYICEGFTDVITLDRCGVYNVVAAMGTAITEDHIKIIKKHADEIIFIMDGDNAGMESVMKSLALINKINSDDKMLKRYVVPLPRKMDVDDVYNKHGKNNLVKFIADKKVPWIKFEINYLKSIKFKDDESLAIKEMINRLKFISDDIERQVYIKTISDKTGINVDSITTRDNIENKTLEETQQITIKKALKTQIRSMNNINKSKKEIDVDIERQYLYVHGLMVNENISNQRKKDVINSPRLNSQLDTIANYITTHNIIDYNTLTKIVNNNNSETKVELLKTVNNIKECILRKGINEEYYNTNKDFVKEMKKKLG